MSAILLSIRPEYAAKILNDEKRYEYRKNRFREDVDKVIIYVTAPEQKVVGEAKITEVITGDVLNVWFTTEQYSGIGNPDYLRYFTGKNKAYAYKLENVIRYNKPKTLSDIGVQHAPQSFRYLPA